MKKIPKLISVLAIGALLCSCGANSDEATVTKAENKEEKQVAVQDSTVKKAVNKNDEEKTDQSKIIETEEKEEKKDKTVPIKIGDKIEAEAFDFTLENVELAYDVYPSDTSGYYTYYPSEDGKIYVHISGNYYNKSKRDIMIRDLFIPTVDYDTDYSYTGFAMVDDGNRFDYASSYVACTPLETCIYHGMVECPVVVEESEAPLCVKFKVDNQIYEYTVR